MFFSVITKNLNWEILRMGLRMKNFIIIGVRCKILHAYTTSVFTNLRRPCHKWELVQTLRESY